MIKNNIFAIGMMLLSSCSYSDNPVYGVSEAIMEGNIALVTFYLDSGINVDSEYSGIPLLMFSLVNGCQPKMLRLLLARDANIRVKDRITDSGVVHYAAESGNIACLTIIKQQDPSVLHFTDGSNMTGYFSAAKNGHTDVALFLFESGVDINIKPIQGVSISEYAEIFDNNKFSKYIKRLNKQ